MYDCGSMYMYNLWFKSDMTILGKIILCSLRHDHLSASGNPILKVSKVLSQIVI